MRLLPARRAVMLVAGLSILPASLAATAAGAQAYPPAGYPPQPYPAGNAPDEAGAVDRGGSYQPAANGDDRDYMASEDDLDAYDGTAPAGYDPSRPPPPPPGYWPDPAYAADPVQDRRYEAYAEDWSQRYCVRARSDAGAGAVIGGLLGALVGSSVSGWRDRGTGALLGSVAGAAGGAVVGGASANDTSPGCPPGYVVRGGAPAFAYGGYDAPYDYAAPGWYQPWIFVGDRWTYRPYPYHGFYYGARFYGRGGYRGGYGGGRGFGGRRGHRY